MARIIGGLGSPHAPSIGALIDKGAWQEPGWEKLLDGYRPMQAWLRERRPDLAILIYNDHVTSFFFDRYPTFALSVAEEHPIADEGFGPRPLPPVRGDAEFAWHVAHSLVDDEFDLTVCQDMPLDHGALTPISALWPDHGEGWPCAILPLAVNVLQFPVPGPGRLFRLGKALRRAVGSFPKDLDVVVLGTGGLSHQLHGERFGYQNQDWDMEFLDRLQDDPEHLAGLRLQDFIERGGAEGAEVIMWLAMRGALSPRVRCLHRNYHAPLHTGFAQVIYEDMADAAHG
ncbi:class III extradiol dioxygenase family protein (plasmid) [Roseomonas gilardii subsp. gilardii]|uniref:class III extradiol dioxygenase family protein n=1 Tax=Roseomonas gilardii TaxID=257708 RepID=UPI001FF965A0|nr:class III extradiol dioxygenase family protein [Roseomonas gilardii]UPG74783.1 class III extradiol dioxygenase family protein [Roseomonas gilardii subsp. gilardii]